MLSDTILSSPILMSGDGAGPNVAENFGAGGQDPELEMVFI